MTMNKNDIATRSGSGSGYEQRRYRDVSPSDAAVDELTWFFNEAEMAMEERTNFSAWIAGCDGIDTLEAVERRAEARHSAGKVHDRLKRLHETDALLLSGLFLERYWSDAVDAALPRRTASSTNARASPAFVCPRARARRCSTRTRGHTAAAPARPPGSAASTASDQ